MSRNGVTMGMVHQPPSILQGAPFARHALSTQGNRPLLGLLGSFLRRKGRPLAVEPERTVPTGSVYEALCGRRGMRERGRCVALLKIHDIKPGMHVCSRISRAGGYLPSFLGAAKLKERARASCVARQICLWQG